MAEKIKTDTLVYIRTDGNIKIATGHLMRCLSIADSLSDLGVLVRFIVSDAESESLLRQRMLEKDYPVICMHSLYLNPEGEIPMLQALFTRQPGQALFIDSYFISSTYLSKLTPYIKIAFMDDLELLTQPVDLIINYGLVQVKDYTPYPHVLLGGMYAPLRRQFADVDYSIRLNVNSILITSGGTDQYNVAGQLLLHFITNFPYFSKLRFHVISGSMNNHRQQLLELATKYPSIQLHENVSDMASLMASCDIAISAGGTTLCELCAVGIPTISYSIADNQVAATLAYDNKKIIKYAGDIRTDPNLFDEILMQVSELMLHYDKRCQMSKAGLNYTDGKGASRIAEALMLL